MAKKQITFQQACFASLGMHALLFGSAIAVAGYAGGAFVRHQTVMMVSLEGPGVGSHVGALLRNNRKEVVRERVTPNVRQEKDTSEQRPTSVRLDETPGLRTEGGQIARRSEDRVSQQGSGERASSGPGGSIGLISASEWAAIESAIERSKNYPSMARERGIQGVVRVRFKLKPSGDIEAAEIVKSSGHAVLDSASLRTVYRAAPMPYVNGWVEVPIAYVLK